MHWLQQIIEEQKTTVYKIAKKAKTDKSILYRLISNNANFGGMSITTMNALAVGLGMTAQEFLDKYFDRFMEIKKTRN